MTLFETGLVVAASTIALVNVVRARGSQRDAAEAEDVLEKVIHAKQELEAVFDTLLEFVFIVGVNGTVLRVSAACAKALGGHPRDMVGKPVTKVFAGHSEKWFGDEAACEIEDAGFKTVFEVTRLPLGPLKHVVVARDVGETRRLAAQLGQADHLVHVGAVAAEVGQDLTRPVSMVMGKIGELRMLLAAYSATIEDVEKLLEERGQTDVLQAVRARGGITVQQKDVEKTLSECIDEMGLIRVSLHRLQTGATRV